MGPFQGGAISRLRTVWVHPDQAPEDRGTLGLLYRRHWDEIRGYVRRRFGAGPPEPEDVAQAAFLRMSSRADLEAIENPRAFLYRTAFNVAVEERRRLAAKQRAESAVTEPDAAAADDRDPERVLSGKERRRLLSIAFATLEPRTRQILMMSREDELSSAEIARRLGLSPTHVKRLIAQALAHCRAVIEAESVEGRP